VNIAARLESETKNLGMPLVISEVVAEAAGLDLCTLKKSKATLKGRKESVQIFAALEPLNLNV
jgi:class 3 adenylate cyclase